MAERWVVVSPCGETREVDERVALDFARSLDPFVTELEEGMEAGNYTFSSAAKPTVQRSEEEKALWSFTSTLHTQIHKAADAAGRGETNAAMDFLFLVRDRINHFLGNKKNPNHRGI